MKHQGVFDEVLVSASSPLKPLTDLPEGLRDLPREGFVRRPPATHEEAQQGDVIFGVETVGDLLRKAERRRDKSEKALAKE